MEANVEQYLFTVEDVIVGVVDKLEKGITAFYEFVLRFSGVDVQGVFVEFHEELLEVRELVCLLLGRVGVLQV